MASNFKISVQKNKNKFDLNLIGDFDRTSALEVIDTLKAHCSGASRISIHTTHLNHENPFELIEREWSTTRNTLL